CGQDHVPHLVALALPDRERTGIPIEIVHPERREISEPRAGCEPRLYQQPEPTLTGVNEPLCFGNVEVADAGTIDALKPLDSRPCRIGRSLTVPPCHVQRGFQDGECPVCRCLASPLGLCVIERGVLLCRSWSGAQPRRSLCQFVEPIPDLVGCKIRNL